MSRNLFSTSCYRCDACEVGLDEQPREITPEDCGRYIDEFRGMLVANATCPNCGARYLAWCQDIPGTRYPRLPGFGKQYFDLSFRSTFNDEPGPGDLPKPPVLVQVDKRLDQIGIEQQVVRETLKYVRAMLARMLRWDEEPTER